MTRHMVRLEPAYVLHTRAYRDTSLLIDFFTHQHGRIHAVAKGARGARSRYKGLLQPFVPLLISWSGQGELHTLCDAETQNGAYYFPGDKLLTGLYLNELLVRVLHRHDSHPDLYETYHQTLQKLSLQLSEQIILRIFEKKLLHELGYALPLTNESRTGIPIESEKYYRYEPGHGFDALINEHYINDNAMIFSGRCLLALQHEEFSEQEILHETKRLMRLALAPLLGAKPIKSRELFFKKTNLNE